MLSELRDRGHEVRVRTLASEVAPLADLGIAADPIDPAIEHEDWRARTPVGGLKRARRTFADRATHELADCRRAIAEEQPDALLVDIMAWGANLTAEAAGLPWATFCPFLLPIPSRDAPPFGPGVAPRSDLIGRLRDAVLSRVGPDLPAVPPMNRLRASVGLPPLKRAADYWTAAPRLIYLTAEPFEYPRSDWPASVRMVGPGVWEPPEQRPGWVDGDSRPLILVTASSEFQDDGKLIAVALEALAQEQGVRVVATTAALDPCSFSPPANARTSASCPTARSPLPAPWQRTSTRANETGRLRRLSPPRASTSSSPRRVRTIPGMNTAADPRPSLPDECEHAQPVTPAPASDDARERTS